MPTEAGFFVDWGGNARSTLEPGGGYRCEIDLPGRYVAVTTGNGTLVHEGHVLSKHGGHRESRHQGAARPRLASLGQTRRRVLTGARRKGAPIMVPTTILIDDTPRCVVRPTDMKDLNRFIRNAKQYLLAEKPDGRIAHRSANEIEAVKWYNALALHKAWGGAEEEYFGTPL